MIILASTSDKVQVISSAAAALDVHASWLDNASGTVTPGRTNTAITTATTTDVLASPAPGALRNLETLHVRNKHATNSCDVTVQHTDGTTAVQLHKVTLTPGAALQYVDRVGFALAPGAGVGNPWVLLNTLTASNSATLDDTASITSAYDEYEFEFINVVPVSGSTNFKMLLQVGGTFQTSNYVATVSGNYSLSGSSFGIETGGGASIILSGSGGVFWAPEAVAGEGVCGSVKLFSPNNTTAFKHVSGQTIWLGNGGANINTGMIAGVYKATGAVTGVRFLFTTGNIASGKILVYGRKTV